MPPACGWVSPFQGAGSGHRAFDRPSPSSPSPQPLAVRRRHLAVACGSRCRPGVARRDRGSGPTCPRGRLRGAAPASAARAFADPCSSGDGSASRDPIRAASHDIRFAWPDVRAARNHISCPSHDVRAPRSHDLRADHLRSGPSRRRAPAAAAAHPDSLRSAWHSADDVRAAGNDVRAAGNDVRPAPVDGHHSVARSLCTCRVAAGCARRRRSAAAIGSAAV